MPAKAHPAINCLTKLLLHQSAPTFPQAIPIARVLLPHSQTLLIARRIPSTSAPPSTRACSALNTSRTYTSCRRLPDSSVYPRREISSRGSVAGVRNPYSGTGSSKSKSAHSNQSPFPTVHLQANLGSWVPVVLLGIVSGVVVAVASYTGLQYRNKENAIPNKAESGTLLLDNSETSWSDMTNETLPGRPGNLTAEQGEKLRELWVSTLQVFGVLDEGDAKDPGASTLTNDAASDNRQRSGTSASEKPKKKRISLFSRKHKDHDADSTTSASSTATSSVAVDGDDKYGQTKQFHEALAHQSPESLRTTFWSMVKHDHPDALLLRFLRARKWDVEKALIMMVSTMNWRATEMHVDDDIMKEGEGGAVAVTQGTDAASKKLSEDFLAQLRMGKSFLHGVDNSGRPMCVVRARLHKQGEQSEKSLERYTVFVIETARMVLAPPVDTACVIFDMTGFSMANMDYGPVKFMIKCFEANYPESLGVVLVHKAPWIFQGIWKIIRGWLDPVVASKVHFTNNEKEMEEFVPKSRIIKDLGGVEDWSYQYVEPVAGENDKMKDTTTRDSLLQGRNIIIAAYEKATLDWIENNGDQTEVAKKRHEIANELREDYWKLDPYIRARTLYDRIGIINPGGKLDFYPTAAAAVPVANGTSRMETSAADLD